MWVDRQTVLVSNFLDDSPTKSIMQKEITDLVNFRYIKTICGKIVETKCKNF